MTLFPRIHDIFAHAGLRYDAMFEQTVYMLYDWKWHFSLGTMTFVIMRDYDTMPCLSIRHTCCTSGNGPFPRIHDIFDHVGLRYDAMFEHTVYMLYDWKWHFPLGTITFVDHVGLLPCLSIRYT